MQRIIIICLFILLNLVMAQAQNVQLAGDYRVVKAHSAAAPAERKAVHFTPAKIDGSLVLPFKKAWRNSGNGTLKVEGAVLIYANPDGSYAAALEKYTNESRQLSFKWNPAIIAIAHTHPNDFDPEPSGPDKYLADRFGVPILTLTDNGMFMYDPATRVVSKIKERLEWLKSSNWPASDALAKKYSRPQ
jgi:hypothetical protein